MHALPTRPKLLTLMKTRIVRLLLRTRVKQPLTRLWLVSPSYKLARLLRRVLQSVPRQVLLREWTPPPTLTALIMNANRTETATVTVRNVSLQRRTRMTAAITGSMKNDSDAMNSGWSRPPWPLTTSTITSVSLIRFSTRGTVNSGLWWQQPRSLTQQITRPNRAVTASMTLSVDVVQTMLSPPECGPPGPDRVPVECRPP